MEAGDGSRVNEGFIKGSHIQVTHNNVKTLMTGLGKYSLMRISIHNSNDLKQLATRGFYMG